MKLLLADDHTLFRDALAQYIERAEPDSQITAAEDFQTALLALEKDKVFDLILLDFRMPGMENMEGLRKIIESYGDIPVALMSGVAAPEDVQQAKQLGAVAYLPKTLSGKALLKAIQLVLTGERYFPVDHSENYKLYQELGQKPYANTNGTGDVQGTTIKLTPREKEVLSFLAKGASNKEIARELDLQVVTIKLHVRGVCRKLDVKNRTQAALKAKEFGLVEECA